MKRKNDDLLRLAFGELSAEAAASAEAQAAADPAARRELETYRELRTGLQHLPPPPPDGLSAERLRAAILDRELKTRRPAFSPFAWAPVALAAVAAVVFFARPSSQVDPTIVAETTGPSYKTYIKSPEFSTRPATAMTKPTEKSVVPPPVERVASNSTQDEAEVRPVVSRRRERSRRGAAATTVAWSGRKDEHEEKLPTYVLTPSPQPDIAPPSSIISPHDAAASRRTATTRWSLFRRNAT